MENGTDGLKTKDNRVSQELTTVEKTKTNITKNTNSSGQAVKHYITTTTAVQLIGEQDPSDIDHDDDNEIIVDEIIPLSFKKYKVNSTKFNNKYLNDRLNNK